MTKGIEDYLSYVTGEDRYEVIRTLKSSPYEVTELVMPVIGTSPDEASISRGGKERTGHIEGRDARGPMGPFVRKRISVDKGMGWIYVRLFEERDCLPKHSHIPEIYECHALGDELHVVMEFVHGKTLADVIYEEDPSPELAIRVFPAVCEAVMELHESFDPPVIHRDLKPSNIILDRGGFAEIIDLGIARSYKEGEDHDTQRFGTASYAPPEQYGFGQTDVRSDVYALGRLLYYCLTEHTPEGMFSVDQLASEGIPVPMAEVIVKASSFDPRDRYQSVRELRDSFLGAVRGDDYAHDAADVGFPAAPGSLQVAGMQGAQGTLGAQSAPAPYTATDMAGVGKVGFRRKPKLPKALSYIWDVMVVLFWLLILMGCTISALAPTGEGLERTLIQRIIAYPILMGASITFLCYLMLHKPYLDQVFGWMAALDRPGMRPKVLGVCAAAGVVLLLAAVVVYAL